MPLRDVILNDDPVYIFSTLMTFLIQLTYPAYLGHPAPDKMSQDAYFPLPSAAPRRLVSVVSQSLFLIGP